MKAIWWQWAVNLCNLVAVNSLYFVAFFLENALMNLIWNSMKAPAKENPDIAKILSLAQLVLAVVNVLGAIIHSGFSLYGQTRLDYKASKD